MSPDLFQEAVKLTVLLSAGGGAIIGGYFIVRNHRKPWALRNRRRPRKPHA